MAQCPAEALADTSLPASARVVLVVLWAHAGRDKRFVWPSRETLAQASGLNMRTLRRHLATLKASGWIVEHDGVNGRPGWSLCDPPGVVAHSSEPLEDAAISGHEAANTGQAPADSDRRPAKTDRPKQTARPIQTAEPASLDRPFSMEPTKNSLSGEPPSLSVVKNGHVRDARRERDLALAQFHELARWHVKPPENCGAFVCPPQYVYDLLDQGETPEGIAEVLRKAARRIDDGHLEARLWGAPLLKGWYGAIRDDQPIGGKGGRSTSGPRIDDKAEAESWAREHGGTLPSGWRWQLDGNGGADAVRDGGAS